MDAPGDQGQSEAYSLNPWEESPLQVEPVEKTVILPDSQLQVCLWNARLGEGLCRGCSCFTLRSETLET